MSVAVALLAFVIALGVALVSAVVGALAAIGLWLSVAKLNDIAREAEWGEI